MLDDTVMDYEQKLVIYPFIPDSYSQWGISTPLSFVKYDYLFFIEFSNYCNSMYGLTEDEVKYVWGQYKVIFDHKINSKPMNESIDNKKEKYLDKIVQYLVEDTDIYYEDRTIGLDSFWGNDSLDEWREYDYDYILDYCEDTYGLTEDEIKYVWYEYKKFMLDKIKLIIPKIVR